MARSVWAATGAIMLALALTPSAALAAGGGSRAAQSVSSHTNQPVRPVAKAQVVSVTLFPGAGYRQARGSGRVRALQHRLARFGFAPGPIDGRYGPLTTAAVERFQAAVGLAVDGITGPRTITALDATPSAALFPGAGYQQAGGSGRVRALQRRLARLGFSPGPIDGRYGALTTAAVERFQARHRLTTDGIVGEQTLHALRLAQRRAPTGHPRRVRPARPASPTPRVKPAPRARPAVGNPSQPTLPVTLVLLAFVAVGMATILVAYSRTRAAVRRPPSVEMPEQRQGLSTASARVRPNPRLVMPPFSITRAQLERAARLRAEGASWNEIRHETGTQLGVKQFMRAWEREGIRASHRSRHQPGEASDGNATGGDQ